MGIMGGIVSGGGGGAGVTAPTLEVGLSLTSSETQLEYDIVNNDSDNPAAVELAFTNSALKAVTYDHGTPQSPSFAIDPGQTRTVNFERDTGAPTYGDPDVTETITGTLADGGTVSSSVTVAGIQFKSAIRSLGVPLFEFLWDSSTMTGEVTNTGSVGATRNAILYNGAAVSATSDGFDGKLEITASNQYVQAIAGQEPLRADFCRTQDRSYVFVWDNITDLSAWSYLMISDGNGSNNGPGWTTTNATHVRSQYCWTGGAVELSAANGTHSAGGTAEDMLITRMGSGDPRRCMMTISYDHAGGTATIRWKQTGHASGHTYRTSGSNADSSAGALTVRWAGWSAGSTAYEADWRYTAVVDGLVDAALFDQLAGIAGL